MGAWYIDRSRNLSAETKWIKSLLFSIDRIDPKGQGLDSKELINLLPEILKSGKNPHAILTYLRDIGFLNLDNKLGENSKLLLSNNVGYKDLIFELLFKRPYAKDQEILVRPLVVILLALFKIYSITHDFDQMNISWYECHKFLFNVKDYLEIDDVLIESILQSRVSRNSGDARAVLDIWFNALKKFQIFKDNDDKYLLQANPEFIDFFELIERNKDKLYIKFNEYVNNQELYNYYGKMDNGLVDIIPNIDISKLETCLESNVKIVDHLFGYDCILLCQESFGLLRQFRWCMSFGLRSIFIKNRVFGEKLIAEALIRSNEYFENQLYIKIAQEYIENRYRNIEVAILNTYINRLMEYQLNEMDQEYKLDLFSFFENRCVLCGENRTELLNVSRIKPFSSGFDISESFDIDNSILLCLEHSHFFETGIIFFDMSGKLYVKNLEDYKRYQLERFKFFRIPEKYLTIERRKYLGYHSLNSTLKDGKLKG